MSFVVVVVGGGGGGGSEIEREGGKEGRKEGKKTYQQQNMKSIGFQPSRCCERKRYNNSIKVESCLGTPKKKFFKSGKKNGKK